MNAEKRVAIACFLGGLIGAALALKFNHYFWWLGALVGAAVAYVSYEPKKVGVILWTACVMIMDALSKEYHPGPWIKEQWRQFGNVVAKDAPPIINIIFCIVMSSLWTLLPMLFLLSHDVKDRVSLSCLVSTISGFVIAFFLHSYGGKKDNTNTEDYIIALKCNPFGVVFYQIPRGVWKAYQEFPKIRSIVTKFFIEAFRLIHSDIRLLCMTDGLIGGAAGYFLHSPLLGGAVGAILGVVNYHFVSVRWLKLVKV